MSVKQEEKKNPNDNFLQAQYRTKQLVTHEKEEQEKQTDKIVTFFKTHDKKKIFEKTSTMLLNHESYIGSTVDFSYYQLNFDFLKTFGMHLEEITTKVASSDSNTNIVYSQYYVDRRNVCIILVKYYFKHVRIYSDNGKTDVMTYAFVNTKAEIHYYDEVIGHKVLKRCKFNDDISLAQNLIKEKKF